MISNITIQITQEAFDELRDMLHRLSKGMEKNIIGLQSTDKYLGSIDELFRGFHSLKAISNHLNINNIFTLAKTMEDFLSILKHREPPAKNEVVDWLLRIADKVIEWSNIQEDSYEFAPVNPYILNMVKSSTIGHKRQKELLSRIQVTYLDDNANAIASVVDIAQYASLTLRVACSELELYRLLENNTEILLINTQALDSNIEEVVTKAINDYNIPTIIVSNQKITSNLKKRLQTKGAEYFLSDFLNANSLLHQLMRIIKIFFDDKSVKIANHPLRKRVSEISPLSSTVTEINQLMSKQNSSLRELSDIVLRDIIVSAKILKAANSPALGLKGDISCIHHAISLLGKEQVAGLVIQSELDKSIKMDLSPYLLSNSEFYTISYLRMSLAQYWYPKVCIDKTGTIITAALLANLGQIVIADEVKKINATKKFQEMVHTTSSPVFAEIELFGTTSEDITADILSRWGIDRSITELLYYAHDIALVHDDLKHETIALHAIINTIPSFSMEIHDDKVAEVCDFLKEMNFSVNHYIKAVDRVRESLRYAI